MGFPAAWDFPGKFDHRKVVSRKAARDAKKGNRFVFAPFAASRDTGSRFCFGLCPVGVWDFAGSPALAPMKTLLLRRLKTPKHLGETRDFGPFEISLAFGRLAFGISSKDWLRRT
jgi:hypothetical protein